MHVDVPEGDQGGCYAVQFILKSRAFLLELADYRLHQCFWHEAILSLGIGPKTVSAEGPGQLLKYRVSDNVGGVKHFWGALARALRRARHFALVEALPYQPKARS